jgi:hypothetical protein
MAELEGDQKSSRGAMVSRLAWLFGFVIGFAVVYSKVIGLEGITASEAAFDGATIGLLLGATLNGALWIVGKIGSKMLRGFNAVHGYRHAAESESLPFQPED